METDILKQLKKKAYNKFTAEGTIVRGAVYLEKPGAKYQEKLRARDQKELLNALRLVKNKLALDVRMQRSMLEIDVEKGRIITSEKIVKRHARELHDLKLVPAIVEELPEEHFLEIEIDFL